MGRCRRPPLASRRSEPGAEASPAPVHQDREVKLAQALATAKPHALVLVVHGADEACERVDLAAELDLGWNHVGVPQHLVGGAQVGRYPREVLELERPAGPGEVLELTAIDRLGDPCLRDALEEVHDANVAE